MAQELNHDYILICEDDHQFTDNYYEKRLHRFILDANKRNADVLLGGIHWFNSAIKVSPDLFWVDIFTGTHFMIVYRKFFNRIIEADFQVTDISDLKISDLTDNKFVIYPFIATQKEFGYSDVTPKNGEQGHINRLFKGIGTLLQQQNDIRKFYQAIPIESFKKDDPEFRKIAISTYIIKSAEQPRRFNHVKKQFKNRKEFHTTYVEALKNEDGTVDLWRTHLEIINLAVKNELDVIIICEDDHEFTDTYSWEFFLKNILEAHEQEADLLLGGAIDFGFAVPITADRYWINQILPTSFTVVFNKFFTEILKCALKENEGRNITLSELTDNKMLLNPTISIKKDMENFNNTSAYIEHKELLTKMCVRTSKRLEKINKAYLKYRI